MQQYHKRSSVESTFAMTKAKFGDCLRSRAKTVLAMKRFARFSRATLSCLIQSMFELKIEQEFCTEGTLESSA